MEEGWDRPQASTGKESGQYTFISFGFSGWLPPGEAAGRLLGLPGDLLKCLWAPLGASQGPLGASWGLPGELLERLGALLGRSFFEIKF